MTSKIVSWQKAICIKPVDLGNEIYPSTLGKELWVLPATLNPNVDGSGYDPLRNMMVRYDPELKWFPSNLLDFADRMVYIASEMLELQAEFSAQVTYYHFLDWIGEPQPVI